MSEPNPLFDMNLLLRVMGLLNCALIGKKMIVLSAIEEAELLEDGSLALCFTSGNEDTLTPDEATALAELLRSAIEELERMQTRQQISQIALPPGIRRGNA